MNALADIARTLFLVGVEAANPAKAVRRALLADPLPATPDGRIFVIALGKAACAMSEEALAHIPDGALSAAIAVTNYENARDIARCEVIAASHPLPDDNGLKAAARVTELLANTHADDIVLCLISGGGSALLPSPVDGVSLADKIKVNKVLLANGFAIGEMNTIRQQLSTLKGGGLAALAAPATVRSLIISDVVGDDLNIVASGPTAPRIGTAEEAIELLKDREVWDQIPHSAQIVLSEAHAQPQPDIANVTNQLICSNYQSLEAIVAAASEWHPHIVSDCLEGDVIDVAQSIVEFASSRALQAPELLLWGGETTVNITGTGTGGRNQELALRVADLARDLAGQWVFLSGGTDGRDGPTDAAGGIVDAHSCARAKSAGLNIAQTLKNNDSYAGLKAADALLMTGATGTNVADIQMFLRHA